MIKRLILGSGLLIFVLLVLLYGAGSGWFGSRVSAGNPQTDALADRLRIEDIQAQREAAYRLGVPVRSNRPGRAIKQVLFGDFHVHTSFSADAFTQGLPLSGGTGTHTVSDACDFARYCSNLDFWSVNDHAENSTPTRWQETIEAIGRCDAVDRKGGSEERDLVSFVGWEWSHMGTTPQNHFGHRNVILRDLDPESLPTRPIASDSPANYFKQPSPFLLGLMPVIAGDPVYLRYATYQSEGSAVERCPANVPVRDLPTDCREYAANPGELLERLDEWGFPSLVIPHGTTWGMYTPLGSSYAKQLRPDWVDPVRQRLVEVFSGHGNIEHYRSWRTVEVDAEGRKVCPEPRDDYIPGCWQAGEIIRSRCLVAGEDDETCEARALLTRERYLDAPAGMGHLAVVGGDADEWLDAGQCRDCFLPAFNYRPQSSVQSMLALSRAGGDASEDSLRFRFGFIGSSDTHTARPGSGYKEDLRTKMTDARLARVRLPGTSSDVEPRAESQVADPKDSPPNQWLESERAGAYYFTGGLVAVHAEARSREAIWRGLSARETYATSGPRILLWFDLLNPPRESASRPSAVAPMGSVLEMTEAPIFRVRAAGSRKQLPGCPEETIDTLDPERLERLCSGECYHPSDERRLITRIEIIRIRPQVDPDEDLGRLIDDPWQTFACEPDPAGCVVTFSDSEWSASARDAVYYARAIEEPVPTINGAQLRCERGDDGAPCAAITTCEPWGPDDEDCLAPTEHRAWSSPIFVDVKRSGRAMARRDPLG